MKKEKGIDDIFKHGLGDPVDETAFRESDWDGLENMLDERKGKGKIFWLPILGSVAAVLLAFFGLWMFRPQATPTKHNTEMVATKTIKSKSSVAYVPQSRQHPAVNQPSQNGNAPVSKSISTTDDGKIVTQPGRSSYLAGNLNKRKRGVADTAPQTAGNYGISAAAKKGRDAAGPNTTLAAISTGVVTIDNGLQVPAITTTDILPKRGFDALAASKPVSKKIGTSAFRPQFALSVLAASELNGVGSFQSTSSGTNLGLMFSVGVKKFTLSTGANYSTKPYTLPFDQYHTSYQFKNTPQYVTADCRVLDIPINIGYQLYNKSRNKITVGTGISSYIMMHESYTYDYGNTSTLYGPSYYAVKNKGKYIFSIMNLQASYERQINSKVGISLQPYLKVPLSNIGYSQVKVQTFGVAVGLNWNINSLIKPK
ncbi:hypothetical protein [Mucilaginibacter sp. UR6-11]|uniref:hypothetical protein n=1 Tax=Mucilaginibacter sp. UR6-11 TaxID=1435644 RepID=UPI001E3B7DD5|nr:hypothetical protein [Mucilaginibacter sp. UR6-11]MCC8427151.1 hypothetical protein [Mucilaginibacter sp. UR6-11]